MKPGNCYKVSLTLTVFCVLGLATTRPADADTLRYTIIDLGIISNQPDAGGYTFSYARGINNSGQVVGYGNFGVGRNGFRTAQSSPINQTTDNLGNLGGTGVRGYATFANGINSSGQVVGSSVIPYSNDSHAFRTDPNSPINPATDDLGVLGGYIPYPNIAFLSLSYAYGINQSGQVVGSSTTDNRETHAFCTAPESPINPETDDLGTLGGTFSRANGINKSGQVVGYSTTSSGETHAFRTACNSSINPTTDDLGTLGGTSSSANGINKLGQVVGSSTTSSGETHAFRTDSNSSINPETDDLGTLGSTSSIANGINKFGQVVGYSTTASGETHAFLYSDVRRHQNFRRHLIDLNSLIDPASSSNFSVLTAATAINDRGQIVGYGTIPKSCEQCFPQIRAFLATPVKTNEVTNQSSDYPDEN